MEFKRPDIRDLLSQISTEEVSAELEKVSSRYHITGAWMAIVFDPVFALTDYFNIPGSWLQVFFIRLGVAAVTFITLLVRKQYKLPSFIVVLVPFLLISLQNAYTYSLIHNNDILLGHNLNYMALLIAGGMFILWQLQYSLGVILVSAVATACFLTNNQSVSISRFFVEGGILLAAVGVFMIVLIHSRYRLIVKEITARLALQISYQEITSQKIVLEERNERILESIRYAHQLQQSILDNPNRIANWFADSFVLFKPKEQLSTDFYWFYENDDVKILLIADSNDHGVLAAMKTVICHSALNDIVIQRKIYEPDRILEALDRKMLESFGNDTQGKKTGIDAGVLCFSETGLTFASAQSPLLIVSASNLQVIQGSVFTIGSSQGKTGKVFEKHKIILDKWDKLYLFSNGFQEQAGSEKTEKYSFERFRDLLLKTSAVSMSEQKQLLVAELEKWRGKNIQTDDLLVVGIEV